MLVLAPDQALPLDRKALESILAMDVVEVPDLSHTQKMWQQFRPEMLLLPVTSAGKTTLPFISKCLSKTPGLQVIVIANRDQINEAAEAMRAGVADCLFKPFTPERLGKTLAAAVRRLERGGPESAGGGDAVAGNPAPSSGSGPSSGPGPATAPPPPSGGGAAASGPLPSDPGADPPRPADRTTDTIIGSHPLTQALRKAISAVASSPAPVLLCGEVGSGKSHSARAIHNASALAGAPFHSIDCAALTPENLPEPLFSGAIPATLFLDEICDLPAEVQARLIRLIDDEIRPQLRLISATSHNPEAAIRKGVLRRDLYHRLCVAQFPVPALRDRGEDLIEIARQKLVEFASAQERGFSGFSPAALDRLAAYSWPGNIRQLLNVVRNIVVLHSPSRGSGLVEEFMLPGEIRLAGAAGSGPASEAADDRLAQLFQGQSLARIERRIIEAVIAANGGSITRAAEVLDVAPSTLYRKRQAWDDEGHTNG